MVNRTRDGKSFKPLSGADDTKHAAMVTAQTGRNLAKIRREQANQLARAGIAIADFLNAQPPQKVPAKAASWLSRYNQLKAELDNI